MVTLSLELGVVLGRVHNKRWRKEAIEGKGCVHYLDCGTGFE